MPIGRRAHTRETPLPQLIAPLLLAALASCSATCGNAGFALEGRRKSGDSAKPEASNTTPSATPAASATGFVQPRVPLGVNLSGVSYFASALPFVDAMRMADPFLSTNATSAPDNPWDTELADQIPRDPNGYPLEIPFTVPGRAIPQMLRASVVSTIYPGRYTLLYEGDGELEFPASPVTVVSSAKGRVELDVQALPERSIFVAIRRSRRGDHVRNIRLLLPGFADSYARQVFHPTFLARLQGVSTLRFMDWGQTNNSKLERWPDRPTPTQSQGTRKGVALETMIELANRTDSDAWFCVPHRADDQYVEQMAKLIATTLEPERRVYVEYSNELWNNIFEQTGWAAQRGCATGLNKLGAYAGSCEQDGSRYWAGIKWQARRSGQIFRTFERVFGERAKRLVRVVAGQAQNAHLNEKLLESLADPAINPQRSRADVLAIAPYAGGSVASQLVEEGAQRSVNALQILDRVERDIEPAVRDSTRAAKQLADRHGVGLVAYEGGQHLVAHGPAAEDTRFVQALIEANRLPRMGTIYGRMLDAWYQASGGGLMMLFNLTETPTKFGAWGLLESQEQRVETAPKYQAFLERLRAFNLKAAGDTLAPGGAIAPPSATPQPLAAPGAVPMSPAKPGTP
jgi:hypothetical protein